MTCFCKAHYSDFNLTLNQKLKNFWKIIHRDAVPDHSLRKQESENCLKCTPYTPILHQFGISPMKLPNLVPLPLPSPFPKHLKCFSVRKPYK